MKAWLLACKKSLVTKTNLCSKLAPKEQIANSIYTSLPVSVHTLIHSKDWHGGPLLQMASETSRPSSSEISLNHSWLAPIIAKFPDRAPNQNATLLLYQCVAFTFLFETNLESLKVPSGFMLCDVMLMLDSLFFGERLLLPTKSGESKKSLAARESQAIKRLIGALRYLWRSSTEDLCSIALLKESFCFPNTNNGIIRQVAEVRLVTQPT